MALLKASDLMYDYSPTATTGDDPKQVGSPDRDMLNRSEKYEVLDFINSYAEENGITDKATGLKIEKWLKDGTTIPTNIRKSETIKDLITQQLEEEAAQLRRAAHYYNQQRR